MLPGLWSALKNPRLIAGLAVTATIGALWWQVEAKQDRIASMRDSLQTKVQQNAALRDSLERDTSFYEDGILRDLYSRTDFVGVPDTAAPSTVDEGREVERATRLVYEADSAGVEGTRDTTPGDTLDYEFTADLGRYGLQADLRVWAQTGRLDYQFGLNPPPIEIRLYQTERINPSGVPVTETFADVPSGTVRSMRSTRQPMRSGPEPGTPWSYGAAVAASPGAVTVGPRLDYAVDPFYVSLSAGYAPPSLRTQGTDPFTGSIEVGVSF